MVAVGQAHSYDNDGGDDTKMYNAVDGDVVIAVCA